MRKFLLLLCLSILPVSAFWQEITLSSLQKKFSAAYIQEYNIQNLESDIQAPAGSEGTYKNSIQSLSKENTWDKSKFDNFVTALKNKKIKDAQLIYAQNWRTMSPFLPTCCASKKYIAFKNLKNWILALSVSGNWAMGYRFEYIFYANNRLFSILWQDYFEEYVGPGQKNMLLIYKTNPKNYTNKGITIKTIPFVNWESSFQWLMTYWFDNSTKPNSYFKKEYNKFVNYMTMVWK